MIWYGNIPEETIWFRHRWDGAWRAVTLLLVLGHFVVPFFILITRIAKRNLFSLGLLAGWLMFMHLVDIYWIVMPNFHHDLHLSWIDLATLIGIGGLFLGRFWQIYTSRPLVPVGDPKLKASIKIVT